jgi:hypothetical protein
MLQLSQNQGQNKIDSMNIRTGILRVKAAYLRLCTLALALNIGLVQFTLDRQPHARSKHRTRAAAFARRPEARFALFRELPCQVLVEYQ